MIKDHECNIFCGREHPLQHAEVVWTPETEQYDAVGAIRFGYGVAYDCFVVRVERPREFMPLDRWRNLLDRTGRYEVAIGDPAPNDAPAWLVTFRTDSRRANDEWLYQRWALGYVKRCPLRIQQMIDAGQQPEMLTGVDPVAYGFAAARREG